MIAIGVSCTCYYLSLAHQYRADRIAAELTHGCHGTVKKGEFEWTKRSDLLYGDEKVMSVPWSRVGTLLPTFHKNIPAA